MEQTVTSTRTLDPELLDRMDAYWRAANYLSVGQIYLWDNPMLKFSFPGGISSHVTPSTPGSIHEGGEFGYSLSHAFGAALANPELIVGHVERLDQWMRRYRPEELFDAPGRLVADVASLAPQGDRRMGANPHTNSGLVLRDLHLPDFRTHAVTVPAPGAVPAQDTSVLGQFLRDVVTLNEDQRNLRIFGPDETLSNMLGAVFEVTDRQWEARTVDTDESLAPMGRVLDSIAVHGPFMHALGWAWPAFVWAYAILWALASDRAKLFAYRILDPTETTAGADVGTPPTEGDPRAALINWS